MSSNLIFCDEAGFTGDNMLDADQKHFVFSSVNITNTEAAALIDEHIQRFALQGIELKGRKLARHRAGQECVFSLLEQCEKKVLVAINHKPYSLACRFFEWTFAEIFREKNSLLYLNDFHRFIANAIYVGLALEDASAGESLERFQGFMRSQTSTFELFQGPPNENEIISIDSILSSILLFCDLNKTQIEDVISNSTLDSDGKLRWYLDLSVPNLHSLLAMWADRIDRPLEVYCDDSKPLTHGAKNFDVFVGNEEITYWNTRQYKARITYNLAKRIAFVSSETNPAIQLADVFASSICYALDNRSEDFSKELLDRTVDMMSPQSVMPDPEEYFDVEAELAQVNFRILGLLIDGSLRGANVRDELPSIISQARIPNVIA